ncbi:MAG TPA: FAD-binding oxidoreductase [Lacipirellulaceae bacterium]|jgi:glycolate oxidase FAD binding subunit|nr:FAD-binding oxidoreductase [Lacipirellulaceae bacterium]
MTTAVEPSLTQNVLSPNDLLGGVADYVRSAFDANEAVLPVGGGTALDYGNLAIRPGRQLDLSGLAKIVDYTPRDMTILVEAGVRMADLAKTLAAENQQLPIDIPRAGEATIGGVVATNWGGPRRYGHGTIRDYVIGIHAVDGRGVAFKGGGRVVKNVAGYDFCKLLTGSMGTLGVITQVALKVKPQPECVGVVIAEIGNLNVAEDALGRLALLEAPPVAIDLLVGTAWSEASNSSPTAEQLAANRISGSLCVRIEGTKIEVDWLSDRLISEIGTAGGANAHRLEPAKSSELWAQQVEFADRGSDPSEDNSPLVAQIVIPPSSVVSMIGRLLGVDVGCSIQAHAASGVIIARFNKFTPSQLTAVLAGQLRPAAAQLGGSLVVVRSSLDGLTSHLRWGGRTDATVLLERVKHKFDPKNILNPGRFVY